MILLLMGVSGSGKTTVGQALSQKLGWPMRDADDFHPVANIQKMRMGAALTDEDRRPWLEAICQQMQRDISQGVDAIYTCSALKRSYRDQLRAAGPEVKIISLDADATLLQQRLSKRENHFFNPVLLMSQLTTLEDPTDADQRVDASLSVDEIVKRITDQWIG
jgi:gluconokinase